MTLPTGSCQEQFHFTVPFQENPRTRQSCVPLRQASIMLNLCGRKHFKYLSLHGSHTCSISATPFTICRVSLVQPRILPFATCSRFFSCQIAKALRIRGTSIEWIAHGPHYVPTCMLLFQQIDLLLGQHRVCSCLSRHSCILVLQIAAIRLFLVSRIHELSIRP